MSTIVQTGVWAPGCKLDQTGQGAGGGAGAGVRRALWRTALHSTMHGHRGLLKISPSRRLLRALEVRGHCHTRGGSIFQRLCTVGGRLYEVVQLSCVVWLAIWRFQRPHKFFILL